MSAFTIIIGLDPGVSGGIAWNESGTGLLAVDSKRTDLCALAARLTAHGCPMRCYVEAVTGFTAPAPGARPCPSCGQTPNRQPGHAMFTFGKSTGIAIGIFKMAGAEIIEVPAKTWQKPLHLPKLRGPERKRALRDEAQRRFPQIKVTLATADALLIHAYGSLATHGVNETPVAGELPFSDEACECAAKLGEYARGSLATDLFIADWMNVATVFKSAPGGCQRVRTATPEDLATIGRENAPIIR